MQPSALSTQLSAEQIEERAERAFTAFCDATPRDYLPLHLQLTWPELPDVVKNAWKAVAIVLKS